MIMPQEALKNVCSNMEILKNPYSPLNNIKLEAL